jgi:hypothetical protein
MVRKKDPIELRKLSEESNPRLKELLAEISDDTNSDTMQPSPKRLWGRRFNASGKTKSPAPKIRLSYSE